MPNIENCCGGPVADAPNACCALDAQVKAAGGDGCGCSNPQREGFSDVPDAHAEGMAKSAVSGQRESQCCER